MKRNVLLMIILLCAACARVPRPVLAPDRMDDSAKAALLSTLHTQDSALLSFKGLARGVLDEDGARAIVRYVILFKRPDELRIEALPATGAYTLSILAANSAGVVMIDPVNRRGYRSSDVAHALKNALRIPIPPQDLTSYLLGIVPESVLTRGLDARLSAEGVQLVAGDFEGYWLLEHGTNRLKRVELRRAPHARPVLSIEYGAYVRNGGWEYPEQLLMEVPGEALHATITFKSTDFNPPIRDESFRVAIPDDYSIYEGPNSAP